MHIKVGDRVVVEIGFYNPQEVEGTVTAVHNDIKNGKPGIDFDQDNGATRWAYLHQIKSVKNS